MAEKPIRNGFLIYVIAIVAWLVPGLGHWFLGHRGRAVVIFLSICATFLLGLFLGGLEMIEPQRSIMWFLGYMLAGIPGIISYLLQNPQIHPGFGRGFDIGQVYAGVAGLLNLLCILDVLMRCHNATLSEKAKR